jgi:hypothetical protein
MLTAPNDGELTLSQTSVNESTNLPVSKTRFVIGGVLLIGGFLSPLLIPFVTASDLSEKWKAILSTGLVAGLPEVGMLLAVAVLGKQGFAQLKEMIFSRFRDITAPSAVSQTRYRIGLLMFFIPILAGWLQPYLTHFFPALAGIKMLTVMLVDLVFAASFIVLGAGFWEKIRSLFVHDDHPSSSDEVASINESRGES